MSAQQPGNAFTRNGIGIEEWAEALIDAMRTGGATEEEIRELVIGSRADAAMPDDGEWRLYRL